MKLNNKGWGLNVFLILLMILIIVIFVVYCQAQNLDI